MPCVQRNYCKTLYTLNGMVPLNFEGFPDNWADGDVPDLLCHHVWTTRTLSNRQQAIGESFQAAYFRRRSLRYGENRLLHKRRQESTYEQQLADLQVVWMTASRTTSILVSSRTETIVRDTMERTVGLFNTLFFIFPGVPDQDIMRG